MLTWKKSLSTILLAAVSVASVLAEDNGAKTSNTSAGTAGSAEASPVPASPNLNLPATDANVTALLGVLVMKGVLAPNEAKSIQSASPSAQFQALVEALSRKGVLSAADLSAAASPAAQPSAAQPSAPAAPAAAPETGSPCESGSLATAIPNSAAATFALTGRGREAPPRSGGAGNCSDPGVSG
jgi:hypothetical protein